MAKTKSDNPAEMDNSDALPGQELAPSPPQPEVVDNPAEMDPQAALPTPPDEVDPPAADPAHQQADTVTVRVLAAVTIGTVRYQPNDVIEGLPELLLAQHSESLDDHPDAVAHAVESGGQVKTHGAE